MLKDSITAVGEANRRLFDDFYFRFRTKEGKNIYMKLFRLKKK